PDPGPAPGAPHGPAAVRHRARDRVFRLRLRVHALHVDLLAGALPFGTAFLWITVWGFAPAACLTAFVLPLVFPDGRLLSRCWRPVLWAALLIIPLLAVGRAFIPENMGSSLNYLPNPYPIPSAEP